MQYIIAMALLWATLWGSNDYYYAQGKKVYINKTTPLSRDFADSNCYTVDQFIHKKPICLDDEIIIQSDSSISDSPINPLDPLLAKYDLELKQQLSDKLFVVRVRQKAKTLQVANALFENENIIHYAYPNFSVNIEFRADINVSDPRAKEAWHLQNTGQGYNYKVGADVKVAGAWHYNQGKKTKIGLIDDGIELNHPDVVYSDGYSIKNPVARDPSHYATNNRHHGTKAASLMVAKNNNIGSIGVAPNALLYVVNIDGPAKVLDIVNAFIWLRDKEVDVINNSWGTYKVADPVVSIIKDLLENGRGGKGIPIVFSAGNDYKDLDAEGINDESEIEGVISVGATTPFDSRYHRTNYGKSLSLMAPGVELLVARQDGNQTYTFDTGTSLSAPIVSAGIALMISENKELSAGEIRQILTNTADKVGTNEYTYDANGHNKFYGFGRVNLADALREASIFIPEARNVKKEIVKLEVERGWNLLSIPVSKAIHQKDFKKYFGENNQVVTMNDNGYNYYTKMIFPEDGFLLKSNYATTIEFEGVDYNTSFTKTPIRDGKWNLLGVGRDSNLTHIKTIIKNIEFFYLFDTQKQKFVLVNEDNKSLPRGTGFLFYKLPDASTIGKFDP